MAMVAMIHCPRDSGIEDQEGSESTNSPAIAHGQRQGVVDSQTSRAGVYPENEFAFSMATTEERVGPYCQAFGAESGAEAGVSGAGDALLADDSDAAAAT
jgi:hypothetical protein